MGGIANAKLFSITFWHRLTICLHLEITKFKSFIPGDAAIDRWQRNVLFSKCDARGVDGIIIASLQSQLPFCWLDPFTGERVQELHGLTASQRYFELTQPSMGRESLTHKFPSSSFWSSLTVTVSPSARYPRTTLLSPASKRTFSLPPGMFVQTTVDLFPWSVVGVIGSVAVIETRVGVSSVGVEVGVSKPGTYA